MKFFKGILIAILLAFGVGIVDNRRLILFMRLRLIKADIFVSVLKKIGRFMKFISVVLTVLFCLASAQAQTFSVRCKFSEGQATDFDTHIPRTVKSNDMADLVFDQIDIKRNKARLIGNNGAGTVQVYAGFGSVHLLELTDTGNMNITTIFIDSENKSKGTFPVVHSRHIQTLSGPYPSQYLGLCTRLR